MSKYEMLQIVADYVANTADSLGLAVDFNKFLAHEAWGKIAQLVDQIVSLG